MLTSLKNNVFIKNKFIFYSMCIFIFINILWFLYSEIKYNPYLKNLENTKGVFHSVDSEGYNFSASKPAYLETTGNLAVVYKDNTLIIWPKINGEFDYGVIVEYKGESYQISIDKNCNAIKNKDITNEEYNFLKEIIDLNNHEIKKLLEKAFTFWNLQ